MRLGKLQSIKLKILKRGDRVLDVCGNRVLVLHAGGTATVFAIRMDREGYPRVDVERTVKIGRGDRHVEADEPVRRSDGVRGYIHINARR